MIRLAEMLGRWADHRDGEILYWVLTDRGIDPFTFDVDDISESLWEAIKEEVEECRESERDHYRPNRPVNVM